jgi:FkbM family methyltransferase
LAREASFEKNAPMTPSAHHQVERCASADVPPVPAGTSFSVDHPKPGSVHRDWVLFSGWVVSPLVEARSSGDPSQVRIDLVNNGAVVETTMADLLRADVADALAPRQIGACGFAVDAFVADRSGEWEIVATWREGSASLCRITISTTDAPVSTTFEWAQAGEASALQRLLPVGIPQVVVDVGAHDGLFLSNSYPFFAAGWSGILIEPMPQVFQRLRSNHRRHPLARCIQAACTDHDGSAQMFIGADGPLGQNSTLCTDDNEWMDLHRTEQSIEVRAARLSTLLDESGHVGDIGLLMVDCEGMDYEALCGLDIDRHRPWIVVTEMYRLNPGKETAKHALLKEWGMSLAEEVGYNEIWISDAHR